MVAKLSEEVIVLSKEDTTDIIQIDQQAQCFELLKTFKGVKQVLMLHEDRIICDDEIWAPCTFSEELVLLQTLA